MVKIQSSENLSEEKLSNIQPEATNINSEEIKGLKRDFEKLSLSNKQEEKD